MIENYIIKMLGYAIAYSLIYIIIKSIYLRHNNQKFVLRSELLYIMFGAYITALFSQTIMPIWHIFYVDGRLTLEISAYKQGALNMIPFKTISEYLTGSNDFNDFYGGASMTIRIVNLLGNVCVFIPFGFLFPIAFKKFSKFPIPILAGILLSVFIEIMQIFVGRSTDIDDVILNGTGVILGFICYKILSILVSKKTIVTS